MQTRFHTFPGNIQPDARLTTGCPIRIWAGFILPTGYQFFIVEFDFFHRLSNFYRQARFLSPDISFLPVTGICFRERVFFIGQFISFHRMVHVYRSPEFIVGEGCFLSVSHFFSPDGPFLPVTGIYCRERVFLIGRSISFTGHLILPLTVIYLRDRALLFFSILVI